MTAPRRAIDEENLSVRVQMRNQTLFSFSAVNNPARLCALPQEQTSIFVVFVLIGSLRKPLGTP